MTWTYNLDIPNPPNKPSQDVSPMKVNTNSIASLVAVDHIGFNANNGGMHNQNRYVDFSGGPLPGGIPASVAFPAAGAASSSNSVAQYYFKNSLATLLMTAVKAFGSIPFTSLTVGAPAVPLTIPNSYNFIEAGSTQAQPTTGLYVYTINLSPNCVVGLLATVFVYIPALIGFQNTSYAINANQLVITYNFAIAPATSVNFLILQA